MHDSIDAQFGRAIKRLRLKLGVSQETLAERAKLHRTYISDVERGARNLSLRSIQALANALGVRLSVLFAEVERASPGAVQREFERCRLGGKRIVTDAMSRADDYTARLQKLYQKIENLDAAVQSVRHYNVPRVR